MAYYPSTFKDRFNGFMILDPYFHPCAGEDFSVKVNVNKLIVNVVSKGKKETSLYSNEIEIYGLIFSKFH